MNRLKEANDEQITQVIQAVIKRYGIVHPDWELCFLTLPKNDPKEREWCIRAVADMLLRESLSTEITEILTAGQND